MSVEIVTLADYKAAAAVLADCFEGDDISNYLFGHIEDPEYRKKAEQTYFECIVYSHILKGLVTGIRTDQGTSFETVCVWSLPESGNMEDFVTYWRSGFYKLSWQVGRSGRNKIYNDLFDMLYKVEEEILGDSGCYTIVYLGSTSQSRGKGNVRKMMQFMFENYIDKNKRFTYLECSALSNIPIYEKFNFTAVRKINLGSADSRAEMHIMVRPAPGMDWDAKEVQAKFGYVRPSV